MKFQKPIALISGLVLAVSLPITSALADTVTVSAEKSANVRSGAGMNYPVIGWAMRGDTLESLGIEGKWTKVQLKNGKVGYIYSSLLNGSTSSAPSTPSGSTATVTAVKSANVRAGASNTSAVIGWAMRGDTVTLLEKSGNWYKVQLKNGKTGYIHASMLSVGGGSGSGSSGGGSTEATGNAVIVTKYASSTVNLRESKEGKVIASLKSGTPVTIIAKDGEWYQVKAGGQTGYVYAVYVMEGTPAQTTGDVNMRSGAGTGYSIVRVLKKGTAITVLEKSGNWVKVLANGQIGFIHSAYCSK